MQTDRRLLSREGILIVSWAAGKDAHDLRSSAKINSRGFIYLREEPVMKATLTDKATELLNSWYHQNQASPDTVELKKYLIQNLEDFVYSLTKRRPIILPVLLEL